MQTILVNIDGTLADITHRLHFLDGPLFKPKNWNNFFNAMSDDKPIEPICTLVKTLISPAKPTLAIVFVSGHPDNHRAATLQWLGVNVDGWRRPLYMRAAGDYRADDIVKRELLATIRADGFEPVIAIDNRQRVVDMWREEGLICLQAADPARSRMTAGDFLLRQKYERPSDVS